MTFLEFVLAVVLVSAAAKVLQTYLQTRPAAPPPIDSAEVVRARDEVRQLKERIQVLERVITDNHGSHELDREIERLRDR